MADKELEIEDKGGGWFQVGDIKVRGKDAAKTVQQDLEDDRWDLGFWNGILNYECTECPRSYLDKEKIVDHYQASHVQQGPGEVPEPEPIQAAPMQSEESDLSEDE